MRPRKMDVPTCGPREINKLQFLISNNSLKRVVIKYSYWFVSIKFIRKLSQGNKFQFECRR